MPAPAGSGLEKAPQGPGVVRPGRGLVRGPGYWGYATKYTVLTLALQSALGSDFGLSTLPGLSQTGLFRLHGAGPAGHFFNFADGRRARRG